jgi:hypothetical protein
MAFKYIDTIVPHFLDSNRSADFPLQQWQQSCGSPPHTTEAWPEPFDGDAGR